MKSDISSLQFDWDTANSDKNKRRHNVSDGECEETFFDQHKVVLKDKLHSGTEERFILLGKTKQERLLFIAFTKRNARIRIISARDVTKKKEVRLYEKAT